MGVLQDFERRLEGAVEGFFARAFRSGLQPIELAKAVQRYAEDTQHVTDSGVVVPNVYRFELSPRDRERFETYGESLPRELADVAVRTAQEHGWRLRGPVVVRLATSEDVRFGTYRLAGRVEAAQRAGREDHPAASPARSRHDTMVSEPVTTAQAQATVRVVSGPSPERTIALRGIRATVGRMSDNPVPLEDPTVSRQHAAFVRRGDRWWIVDLGSTNGTRVNGTLAAEQALSHGDRVELGETVLEFVET